MLKQLYDTKAKPSRPVLLHLLGYCSKVSKRYRTASALSAVIAGGKAGLTAEDLGKVAGIRVAHIKRNGDNTLFRFTQ